MDQQNQDKQIEANKEKIEETHDATFKLMPSLATPLGKAVIALLIAVLGLLVAKIDEYTKPASVPAQIIIVEKDKK